MRPLDQVDPYDFDLTANEVDLFRKYFSKKKKLSEEELKYYVKEYIIFARFFLQRYMNEEAIKLQSYVNVELKKKGYSEEEIDEWIRYKEEFFEQRKINPKHLFDTKFLKIAKTYNKIIENRKDN